MLLATTSFSQPKDNAPYSSLGLGEPTQHSLATMGYGGLSAAFIDPLHVNYLNPAHSAWMSATAYEAGAYFDRSKLKFGGESAKVWGGNLTHLALAFPLFNPLNDVLEKKKRTFFWGMHVALVPYSSIGYDVRSESVLPQVDTVLQIFQGTGGLNRFMYGNAWRYKQFSFGVNLQYLFGTIESERRVQFQSLDASYDDVFIDNIALRGWSWSAGAQFKHYFNAGPDTKTENLRSLSIGVYGQGKSNISTTSQVLRLRENYSYTPFQSDTLLVGEDVSGKGKLPAGFQAGLMYEHGQRLKVGMEYGFEKWSAYENEAKPDQMRDVARWAVGVQYTPNPSSYNNYWQRVRYRIGFYHQQDPRLDDLNKVAFTFGLGLPVILPRQQTSFVNLGLEIGRYNTSNAIEENFVKMAVTFTLNDTSWFLKRKFG